MIDSISYRRLSLEEKQNFVDEALPILQTRLGENPTFKSHIDTVETSYNLLKASAQTISHPELTALINEGNAIREGGLRSLKGSANHSINRPDPVWIKSGQQVLNLFREFGENMADLPIAKQTAAVENFLGAIDRSPELKQDITTIQGDIWLQDIRDGQQKVKAGIATRDASKKNDDNTPTDVAKELGVNLDKLFRYINMKIEFEPTPELKALSVELNKVIVRYRRNISLRATLRDNAKKDDTEKE